MTADDLCDLSPALPATAPRGLRLRLKPARHRCGFVHGAWWPRSTQLTTELPLLLAAFASRLGRFDRAVYDENVWAPAPLHLGFRWQRRDPRPLS
jgi:uncharacterized protein DUF5994